MYTKTVAVISALFLITVYTLHAAPGSRTVAEADSLLKLSRESRFKDADVSLKSAWQALKLSKTNGYKRGEGEAHYLIAAYYSKKSNYDSARKHAEASLYVLNRKHDLSLIGDVKLLLGNIHLIRADLKNGLSSYLECLKIREELSDSSGMASAYTGIGNVYFDQRKYEMALVNHRKAYAILLEINDSLKLSKTCNNIGNVHYVQKDFVGAVEYYQRAIDLKESLGQMTGLEMTYNNIGGAYGELRNYAKAKHYFVKCIELALIKDNKEVLGLGYLGMGSLLDREGDLKGAISWSQKGLKVNEEIGNVDNTIEACLLLSILMNKANNSQMAFYYLKRHVEMKDSVYNLKSSEQMAEMQALYETEKKDSQIKLLNKDKEVQAMMAAAEHKKQNVIIFAVSLILILVLIFTVLIYRGYRAKQKANEIIAAQKDLVEEKQKEILDSIHYARRIQHTLLPTQQYIRRSLERLNT